MEVPFVYRRSQRTFPVKGCGWGYAELSALAGRYALRAALEPFGPERVSHWQAAKLRHVHERCGWLARAYRRQSAEDGRPEAAGIVAWYSSGPLSHCRTRRPVAVEPSAHGCAVDRQPACSASPNGSGGDGGAIVPRTACAWAACWVDHWSRQLKQNELPSARCTVRRIAQRGQDSS